jgi:F420H(2)-dependent quinone reductase
MAFADFRNALNDANEIALTTTGRISGRQSSRPVWFVLEGETLYLLPVTGSDGEWYKNVLKTPTIRLAAGGPARVGVRPAADDRRSKQKKHEQRDAPAILRIRGQPTADRNTVDRPRDHAESQDRPLGP